MSDFQIDTIIRQAVTLANAGRRDEAARLLREVTRRDPDRLSAWRWLAYCTDDRQEALRAIQVVLNYEPHDAWARAAWADLGAQIGWQAAQAAEAEPVPRARTGVLPLWVTVIGILLVGMSVLIGTALRAWMTISELSGSGSFSLVTERATPYPSVEPAPQVIVNESTEYYTFQAWDVASIQRHLYRDGPLITNGRHSIAVTTYQISTSWDLVPGIDSCRIGDSTVQLDLTYTYPDWEPTGSPSPALYDEWDRFIQHVIAHEQNHGRIALTCANEIAAEIGGAGPLPTCDDLETEVNGLVNRVYAECEARQQAFDDVEGETSFPLPR